MPTVEKASPAPPDEPAAGQSAAGRAANTALRCFSKAARAFTLYEPQNEAVRRFLQEYREAMQHYLGAHGALDLEVRASELVLRGEVVHAEKDREKSLAYRLFRDGIRRLTIAADAPWEEQLSLLEVLSVRFMGVRQQEEDAVTQLTRTAFRSITFRAASGLVAAEKDEEPAPARKAGARSFPADFDGPPPPLLAPRQFGCFPIPPAALEAFHAEESPAALPGNAVRMVRELLDDVNQEELKTLVPAVEEVRDFLLAELDVKHLRDLARVVAGQHGKAGAILGPALRPLGAPYTLQKLLSTVPSGQPAPDALVELLDSLTRYGADLIDPLLDRIGKDLEGGATAVDPALETLALRAVRGKKERLLARLGTAGPALVDVLLRYLQPMEPGAALETAKRLLANADVQIQLGGVRLLEGAKADEPLIDLLRARESEVRIAAVNALAQRLVRKAFGAIADAVVERDASGLQEREAEAMGAALAILGPAEAMPLFESFLHPPQSGGLLSRLIGRKPRRMLAWTAAAGLAHLPGEPTVTLLREVAATADEELKRRCLKSIAFSRRGAKPNV